jgi:hypothetical protein
MCTTVERSHAGRIGGLPLGWSAQSAPARRFRTSPPATTADALLPALVPTFEFDIINNLQIGPGTPAGGWV